MKPAPFLLSSKKSLQERRPILLGKQALFIVGAFIFIFMAGCGNNSPSNALLDTYRIQIGEKEFNFKQQMLYVQLALEIYRLHVGARFPEKRFQWSF
ncbi:MAG: hypothetical protein ACP5I1_04020, partial [Candidatus Hinthialibacter sp.]